MALLKPRPAAASADLVYGEVVACRATPDDGQTTGSTAEATTTVDNTAPVVVSVSPSPPPLYTNDTPTAASFSDVDSAQSLAATYEWHVVDLNGADSVVQLGFQHP